MVRLAGPACAALAIAVAVGVGAGEPSSTAARRDWVGSDACGSCHPAQLAAWRATPHARAADRLGATPRGRCLACHGTGDAPAGKAYFLEVGCEACHGAGGHYAEEDVMRDPALAAALGLRELSTEAAQQAACAGCHRGTGTTLRAPTARMPIDATSVH